MISLPSWIGDKTILVDLDHSGIIDRWRCGEFAQQVVSAHGQCPQILLENLFFEVRAYRAKSRRRGYFSLAS